MADFETIKCLIVDDEPPAREIIRRYIEQVPLLDVAGECGNAIQAFTFLKQQQHVDLIFLDIRMPQLNGNEFLKALKNPPKVIFTTAFSEYALQGFELDAIDYLLKPITFERFLKAVNKAYQSVGQKTEMPVEDRRSESFVYFRSDRKMVKVMLQDINYIESMKDYVKVYTKSGMIITKQSISSVEAMLPERSFIRTHRSFIVSLDKVKTFTSELIEVDRAEVPIGKLYRNEVMKVLS